jgi:hypothetical protein
VTPLRQLTPELAASPAHLFKPADAWRLRPSNNKDTPITPEEPVGENPPDGASIDYLLGKAAKSVSLEIRDASGALVQTLTDQPAEKLEAEQYFSDLYIKPTPPLPKAAGVHRVQWNLRWTRPEALSYDFSIAASAGRDTPLTPGGALALPGTYSVALKVDGKVVTTEPLTLKQDPRNHPDMAGLQASLALSRQMANALSAARRVLGEVRGVRTQLAALKTTNPDITSALGWATATDSAAAAVGMLAGIETGLESADVAPTRAQVEASGKAMARIAEVAGDWDRHMHSDLPKLNQALVKARLKPVKVPDGDKVELASEAGGEDLP